MISTRQATALAATALMLATSGMAVAQMGRQNPVRHRIVRFDGVPAPYATMKNPLQPTPEVLAAGRTLFADNCEVCHGVNGRGDAQAGRELDPPAPALRLPDPEMVKAMEDYRRRVLSGEKNVPAPPGHAMPGPGMMGQGRMGQGMGPGMGQGMRMGMRMGPGPAQMLKLTTSDGFLMWAISEGGEALDTGMLAFKDVLSEEERWQLVTFIQADLPDAPAK